VLETLPAYYAYLRSGGYSKYTPDDFTGDVRRFGRFLKDKEIRAIRPIDIQQWIGELRKVVQEKTVSRKIWHWFRLMSCAHEPYVWTLRL